MDVGDLSSQVTLYVTIDGVTWHEWTVLLCKVAINLIKVHLVVVLFLKYMLQILYMPESHVNLCAWRSCSILILIYCCRCCWVNDLCAWAVTLIQSLSESFMWWKLHLRLLSYAEDAVQCTCKYSPLCKQERKLFSCPLFVSPFPLGVRGNTRLCFGYKHNSRLNPSPWPKTFCKWD